MPLQRLRRALLAAACASLALVAACGGGGDVESQLVPNRIVVFGDALSDVGQRGARYTINDGSVNNWTLEMGGRYGRPVAITASGGWSYATGNARITAKPDAGGAADTPTVTEQVSRFLAAQRFDAKDLVVINGGISDVAVEARNAIAGTQSAAQATANVRQAARDLGAQVRRLVDAGAQHVAVVGTYNLGRSPWATSTNNVALLQELSARFNEELLVSIVDLGARVLYIDLALYINLVTASPASYELNDAGGISCTSADPGAGIGTGAGQVNAFLCTPGTVLPGRDPNAALFADRLYFTPKGHRLFGDYAYERIRDRW